MSVIVKVSNNFPKALATVDAARTSSVTKATTQIKAHSQKVVPVDTGDLRKSVEVEYDQGPGTSTGEVSYNTGYAMYVEMGTSKMAAQPYLIPAYGSGKHVLITGIVRWLRSL